MSVRSDVDCNKGREIGCQTYCCRLLIRLEPEERIPQKNGLPSPSFVEKNESGYCIHLDRENNLCDIWHTRPKVCRQYSCNTDPLLQIALREPVTSMVALVKREQTLFIPKEKFIQIPCCGDDEL
ncbi:MAG: YkgJ family cysteine cluster protein [Gammaproteobacteria bacterium]|nr:YkgJ family cysteine cluster protein [Gammaproteobacteria bacterium]